MIKPLLRCATVALLTAVLGAACSKTGTSDDLNAGANTRKAVCDAPKVAPSGGSCYAPAQTGGGSDAGPVKCGELEPFDACSSCVTASCCIDLTACAANGTCLGCFMGQTEGAACEATDVALLLDGIRQCQLKKCQAACIGASCNPVTNEGCKSGETCDLDPTGIFVCWANTNDVDLCGACDSQIGPYCKGGMHCLPDGSCARFCCGDADCGSGVCEKTVMQHATVGVCVVKEDTVTP